MLYICHEYLQLSLPIVANSVTPGMVDRANSLLANSKNASNAYLLDLTSTKANSWPANCHKDPFIVNSEVRRTTTKMTASSHAHTNKQQNINAAYNDTYCLT